MNIKAILFKNYKNIIGVVILGFIVIGLGIYAVHLSTNIDRITMLIQEKAQKQELQWAKMYDECIVKVNDDYTWATSMKICMDAKKQRYQLKERRSNIKVK